MSYLTIALSKGRLTELSIDMFESIGIDCSELKSATRKLILTDKKNKINFILAKPSDVPTYVEYGVADVGIVGKDTLLEEDKNLYEVLNLGFASCKMVVAGFPESYNSFNLFRKKRVATKYPNIAKNYFEHKKNESIEVIKLHGSVELAPIIGLSEVIVDIVETGNTIKENNLVILENIVDISARMVVNRVSMKIKSDPINKMIDRIRVYLDEKE